MQGHILALPLRQRVLTTLWLITHTTVQALILPFRFSSVATQDQSVGEPALAELPPVRSLAGTDTLAPSPSQTLSRLTSPPAALSVVRGSYQSGAAGQIWGSVAFFSSFLWSSGSFLLFVSS